MTAEGNFLLGSIAIQLPVGRDLAPSPAHFVRAKRIGRESNTKLIELRFHQALPRDIETRSKAVITIRVKGRWASRFRSLQLSIAAIWRIRGSAVLQAWRGPETREALLGTCVLCLLCSIALEHISRDQVILCLRAKMPCSQYRKY